MFFSHVRVARAFQQRCCFFAVTSVTLGKKREGKRTKNQDKTKERKVCFSLLFHRKMKDETT